MFKGFVAYIKRLIDSDNTDDAKVFVGLMAFMYVLVCGYVDLFFSWVPTEFVFFGILGLVLSVFGLTTYLKSKKLDTTSSVASDLINKEPKVETEVIEGTKDIMQEGATK